MPPSNKRSQRTKREVPSFDDANDIATSSPSRPAKRKRTRDVLEEPVNEPTRLPKTQDDLDMPFDARVDAVASHLLLPEHDVQVAIDHDNGKHVEEQQAYAKIVGKSWTFYVKQISINIGRPPEGYIPPPDLPKASTASSGDAELPAAKTEDSRIHIDLGPNKMVSRLHAIINFEVDSEGNKNRPSGWGITVNGRNGVKIDGRVLHRGQSATLRSGMVLEIGGVEMMFLLPENDKPLQIKDKFYERAKLIDPDHRDDLPSDQNNMGLFEGPSSQGPRGPNPHGPLPIAPAPPDYRRANTPPNKQRGGKGGAFSHSPYTAGDGTTMDNIDYSLDENQEHKPPYTYAQLITQAILSSEDEKRTLNDIYQFVKDNYAFYRRPALEKGWQNSIRHNLSLNSGFNQKSRESNEPGKGGYWQFQPEHRQKLINEARGTKRRSPVKSSSPRSPPGQNGRSAHGPGDPHGGSPSRKIKRSSGSPRLSHYPTNGSHFTPDQGNKLSYSHDGLLGDGSPLPRRRRQSLSYGMSDHMQGSPPILSAYATEDGNSLITPAPTRHTIHLAPPSTAQRPSQHMPTSSPAPFWRLVDHGYTPVGTHFDMSPIKGSGLGSALPPSSSPPPIKGDGSPTRNGTSIKAELPEVDEGPDEEPAFDLTKKFVGIGNFHRTNNHIGLPASNARL